MNSDQEYTQYDLECRYNRVLETKLREIINVTYETTNPVIAVTRIRGMAGACLRTYRQEREGRRRRWRDILAALMKKIVDKLLNIVSEIIVILYLLGLVAVTFVILLGAIWILVVLCQ